MKFKTILLEAKIKDIVSKWPKLVKAFKAHKSFVDKYEAISKIIPLGVQDEKNRLMGISETVLKLRSALQRAGLIPADESQIDPETKELINLIGYYATRMLAAATASSPHMAFYRAA